MVDTYKLQRHETSLFDTSVYGPVTTEGFELDGTDLYVEEQIPDDVHLLEARLAIDRSDREVPRATIIANEVLLTIMTEFYKGGEDFHIHQDDELRAYVKDTIRKSVVDVCGPDVLSFVDDAWLNERLAVVRGFPPYGYDQELPEFDDA